MKPDFDSKVIRVLRNDGPGAEVNEETIFPFRQEGDIVHADYFEGGVAVGKLLGLLQGDKMRHSYIQYNTRGEFNSERGEGEISLTPEGRIRMIDTRETRPGREMTIIEEE